jgi:hypothetical protein
LHVVVPGHLGITASLPFTRCHHFQLSDSVLLNAPPSKKARTAETVIENTVEETKSTINSSIPLLSLQFTDALPNSEGAHDLVLPPHWASEDQAPIPPAASGPSKTRPSLLPYKDNSFLGNLTKRFDPKHCQIPNDTKDAEYRPRLVIVVDSSVKHVVYEGQAEFYMADKLSERVHSFECVTNLSNTQSSHSPCYNELPPMGRFSLQQPLFCEGQWP